MKKVTRETVKIDISVEDENGKTSTKSSTDILEEIQAEHPGKDVLIRSINWATSEVVYDVADPVKKAGKKAA